MSRTVAWNIKGVDFDAREAAREAANREGVSLGEWLNEVISERAAELGESPEDFDDDDRLRAVARRLSRMSVGATDKTRRRVDQARARDDQARARDEQARARDDFDEPPRGRRATGARSRAREEFRDDAPRAARREPPRDRGREVAFDPGRAEQFLERAIESFDRRAARAGERTERALAEMSTMIETAQERAVDDGEALNVIADRLADIERRIARSGGKDDSAPIRGALSRLEQRLEDLSQRQPVAEDAGIREIEDKLAEIAARLQKKPETDGADDRLVRIEDRLSNLATKLEAPKAAVAPAPERRPFVDAVAEIAARQRQLDGFRAFEPRPPREPVAPFDARKPAPPSESELRLAGVLERLERKLDQPPPPPAPAPEASNAALLGLQGDIARMANHIEHLREDMARRAAAPSPLAAVEAPLDQIRREMAAVTRGLSELAPRASVSALERAMRDVSEKLEQARIVGAREVNLAPMEQLSDELRASLRQIDSRGAIQTLERDVRAIAAKIDALDIGGGVDPATVQAIHDQTRDMRDLLQRAAAAMPGPGAEREIAELAERVARSEGAGAADIARLIGELRAVVADPGAAQTLRAIDQRIESLAQRLDQAIAGAGKDDKLVAFGERLDMLQRAVAQSLAAPRAAQPDLRNIEAMVGDLADRIERAAEPGADHETVVALERQVERLAAKLEGVTDPAQPLASLQRAVTGLFDELESTRKAALEAAHAAAHEAADNAARQTVRLALSTMETPRAVDPAFVRELAELRTSQGASEKRTHATLTAVHETLERMVERLADFERHAARAPIAPPAAAPAHTPASPAAALSVAPAPPTPARERPRAAREPQAAEFAPMPAHAPTPTPSVAPADDFLIEPGGLRAPAPRKTHAAEAPAQASFIAAARRAALAAQTSAQDAVMEPSAASAGPGALDQARAIYEKRKRPILLGLAAVVMMIGAIQVVDFISPVAPPPAPKSGVKLGGVDETLKAAEPDAAAPVGAPRGPRVAQDEMQAPQAENRAPQAENRAPQAENRAPQAENRAPQADQRPPQADNRAPQAAVQAPQAQMKTAEVRSVGQKTDMRDVGPRDLTPRDGEPKASDPRNAAGPSGGLAPAAMQPAPAPMSVGPASASLPTMAQSRPAPRRVDAGVDGQPVGAIERADPKALAQTQTLAQRGDAAAQYDLAVRYADSARDYKNAAQWFEKSAAKGVAPAQYRLGVLYERGLGVERDTAQARQWYQRAADRGNARAMHNLAVLLADGGGKPEYADAAIWFRKASELGVKDSQFNLAILYARGMGVAQDFVESYAWFAAAAAQGDADAAKKRDEVASRLDPANLARARDTAAAFKARQPDQDANEVRASVATPAPAPAPAPFKPAPRSKVSTL